MKYSIPGYCIFYWIIFISCQSTPKEDEATVTVFCAAGLVDVITELSDSFSIKNQVDIKLNLASSGTLARQLASGNTADIYISASKQWADYTDSLGLFMDRKPLYQNRLVLICPLSTDFDSIDFTGRNIPQFKGRLSMGDPSHVPAGQYAKEALINLEWWDAIQDRTLPTKDVRSALRMVELGECELGIVYYSDAIVSKKVRITGVFPGNSHTPIIFTALLSKTAKTKSIGFYHMLINNNFEDIWEKNGFTSMTVN